MADADEKPPGMPRFAVLAAMLAALLILAAGGLFFYAWRTGPNGAPASLLANAIGGPFHLIDQDGKPFTDADLKGKWRLVFFGYTHCPDVCPTTLNELSLALGKLGAKGAAIGIVFITVDPERDTPAVLKSYISSFDAPIVALTGTADGVREAARAYRVYYARHPRSDGDYDMDHSAVIYLMDPQGHLATTFTPDSAGDVIASRLLKLLS